MPLETDLAYRCPYCDVENFLGVDPSGGSRQQLIEDCQVCCRPIVFRVRVDGAGDAWFESVEAES